MQLRLEEMKVRENQLID